MIQEQEYQKIIHNQNAMYTFYARRIGVLDEEATQMTDLLEYSQKKIMDSKGNFERGVNTIGRIRKNLD